MTISKEREALNPYTGLRPFEAVDSTRFFGRAPEAAKLSYMVVAYPQVLVYGRAGTGKTSLIQSGLVPLLQRKGHRVLPVARPGLGTAGLPGTNIGNPLMAAVLASWSVDKVIADGATLPEFLRHLKRLSEEGEPQLNVMVFDQIEEIFVSRLKMNGYKEFFRQIRQALEEDLLLRAVYVLREDYLAAFEAATGLMKEIWGVRFHLEGLERAAALEAIIEPARQYGVTWEMGVVHRLIDDLAAGGEFIEPAQLQMICALLWHEARATQSSSISTYLLESLGGVTGLLAGVYLPGTIRQIAERTSVKEAELRTWLARALITPSGTRATVLREPKQTAGMANEVLDLLEEARLVRREWRAGTQWVELAHDLLVDAVRSLNRRF